MDVPSPFVLLIVVPSCVANRAAISHSTLEIAGFVRQVSLHMRKFPKENPLTVSTKHVFILVSNQYHSSPLYTDY